MRGKDKCRILREIRRKIAEENDITLITKDCTYQGECRGTCPRCESEVRYLEAQLAQRQKLGKTAVVAALMAGIAMGTTGCAPAGEPGSCGSQTSAQQSETGSHSDVISRSFSCLGAGQTGDVPNPNPEPEDPEGFVVPLDPEPLEGDVPYEPESTDPGEEELLEGEVARVPESTDPGEEELLEGDVAYIPEDEE